jgi:hypothetical protein
MLRIQPAPKEAVVVDASDGEIRGELSESERLVRFDETISALRGLRRANELKSEEADDVIAARPCRRVNY